MTGVFYCLGYLGPRFLTLPEAAGLVYAFGIGRRPSLRSGRKVYYKRTTLNLVMVKPNTQLVLNRFRVVRGLRLPYGRMPSGSKSNLFFVDS